MGSQPNATGALHNQDTGKPTGGKTDCSWKAALERSNTSGSLGGDRSGPHATPLSGASGLKPGVWFTRRADTKARFHWRKLLAFLTAVKPSAGGEPCKVLEGDGAAAAATKQRALKAGEDKCEAAVVDTYRDLLPCTRVWPNSLFLQTAGPGGAGRQLGTPWPPNTNKRVVFGSHPCVLNYSARWWIQLSPQVVAGSAQRTASWSWRSQGRASAAASCWPKRWSMQTPDAYEPVKASLAATQTEEHGPQLLHSGGKGPGLARWWQAQGCDGSG